MAFSFVVSNNLWTRFAGFSGLFQQSLGGNRGDQWCRGDCMASVAIVRSWVFPFLRDRVGFM